MEAISFVCSVILCVIGVLTFVVGMNSRSKSDGVLMQKLDQAVDGIEELKADLKELSAHQHTADLKLQSHEDQIKTLFKNHSNQEAIIQNLTTLTEAVRQLIMKGGG